jgi:secretion/DNA translocation related TadE-like protein
VTGRERGAGSVLVLAATMLIVVAVLLAATVGSGFAARHRAAAAADLAALAAAGEISGTGGGDPCEAAERVSHANGADLRECVVDHAEVEVAAAAPITGPLRWLADPVRRARAGVPPPIRTGVFGAGEWLVPVVGPYRLTARFGETGPHWASGAHTGLDLAAPAGAPVVASSSGRVTQAGPAGPYGNLVVIGHDGVTTYYAHLGSITVAAKDDVAAGHQIGTVGSTGNATGPHLHFEVRVGGAAQNPEDILYP